MRLRALVASATLALTGLAVAPATPAHAETGTVTRLFYLADTAAHPGVYGLWSRDLDGSNLRSLVPGVAGVDLWGAQVSPDGTRVAYLRTDKNATQLWMIDSGGGWNHRVFVWSNRDQFQLRWDGNDALYYSDVFRDEDRVFQMTLDGAPRHPVSWREFVVPDTSGVANPAPDNKGGLIGNYVGDKLVRFSKSGSVPTAVANSPLDSARPTPSADGSTIAFTHISADSTESVPLGELWTLKDGARKVIATGQYNGHATTGPADVVYFDKAADKAHGYRGDLYSVPIDGSVTPTRLTNTPDVDEYAVSAAVVPTTYQGSTTAVAPAITLAGAHPQVSTQGSDTDTLQSERIEGITCRTSGTTVPTVPCSAPLSNGPGAVITDTVLLGSTNTYTTFLTDVYGNLAPTTASRSMQAIGAAVSSVNPTSTGTATAPFRVTWGQGATEGATWSIDWAVSKPPSNVTGAYQHWTTTGLPSAVFGAGNVPAAPTLGDTFYFKAVGTDAYGNSTVLSTGRTVVPFDQTAASYTSGWTTEARAGRWLGSIAGTTTAGAQALVALTGNVYYVIGERCTTCGQVRVYVDGVLKATVDTHASSYQQRQVLWSGTFPTVAKRNLRVQAVGTAGHPRVNLDGFAAKR